MPQLLCNGSKNGGEAFRKNSSQLENNSRIPKKLKDLTKNLSVLEATRLSYPTQNCPKTAWGYPLSKRGLWDSKQHELMLSLKNSP